MARVFWTQTEIEAICWLWAERHVHAGVGFTAKGIQKVALIEGFGFRVRKLPAHLAQHFVDNHNHMARAFATKVDQPLGAMPPAPPPEDVTIATLIRDIVRVELVGFKEQLCADMLEMFKGVPNYNRPVITKAVVAPVREKKFRIVLINAMKAQLDSVAMAFPEHDVQVNLNGAMPNGDYDLVIGLVKFMTHTLEKALIKKYGPRYIRVSGAASAVKEEIKRRL